MAPQKRYTFDNPISADWEYNTLEIYNFNKNGPFDLFFNFIRLNHKLIEGDIVEAGVYRGRSLLATAMLLKELGSDKKVYGFDSFSGFPPILSPEDELSQFDKLFEAGKISQKHYDAVKRNRHWKTQLLDEAPSATNISTSGSFANTNRALIEKKIQLLGLDNIVLIEGPFSDTMHLDANMPERIAAVFVDCDLYQSYIDTFTATWPRVSVGGFYQLDEYFSLKFPGAKIATDAFLQDKNFILVPGAKPDPNAFERWGVLKTG